ncbi:MAG: PHP domain-containing protein [Oligoflexia bacterium]|nr:PHP domain-containing protein [Oligoflexia bacterium]
MFLADLHMHSTFSDGKLSIPELVDLYGQRGFGAIAITDHLCEDQTFLGKAAGYLKQTLTRATWPLYIEILRSEAERAWHQYRMVVIPGFELTKNSVSNHRSAHILAIGATEFMPANDDVLMLARQVRAQGALAIAAHPVSTRKVEKQTFHLWDRREELRAEFDAWEVASGPYIFDEVRESKLPVVASSDLHAPIQMTSWKTVFECERSQGAIMDAIRKQRLSYTFYRDPAGDREVVKNDDVTHAAFPLGSRYRADHLGNVAGA